MTESGFDIPNSREVEMKKIDTLLERLRYFETDQVNPQVERAREVLRETLMPLKEGFEQHGLIPTIHGSMQYHDPCNLDTDLGFVGKELSENANKTILFILPSILQHNWQAVSQAPIDVSSYTVQEIEEDIAIGSGTRAFVQAPFTAGMILSSMPLFPEDTPKLEPIRHSVRNILQNNQHLRTGVIRQLTDVVTTREQRRQTNP